MGSDDPSGAGDPDAGAQLAVPLPEDSDPDQTREWRQRAAQAGHTSAMVNLGGLLEESAPGPGPRIN